MELMTRTELAKARSGADHQTWRTAYCVWKREVDAVLAKLADWPYNAEFADGATPAQAVQSAVEAAGF